MQNLTPIEPDSNIQPNQPALNNNGFIKLDKAIRGALNDIGEENDALYAKFFNWSLEVVNELESDCFHNSRNILLPIQPTLTNTGLKWCKLPDDCTQYNFIGFLNKNGERIALSYNPNLVGEYNEADTHCHCGCGDDLCETLSQPQTTTTDINMVIPVKRCSYLVDFSTVLSGISVDAFDYEYSFPDVVVLGNYPYTIAIIINTILQPSVTINSQSDLDAFFASYGFDNKISDTDYKTTPSQVTTNFGNLIFTGTPFVCSPALIQSTTTLQTARYEPPLANPFPVTNLSIVLGGTTYTSTDTYTSFRQILEWLNGLNFGTGYFQFEINASVNSSIPNYLGNMAYTQTTSPTPVVIDAGITTHIPFQQCIYDVGGFPFSFTGFTIVLGGVTYTVTGTYTSISQITDVLNALNGGSGYFVPVTNRTWNAKINSSVANYFGAFVDTITPIDYNTNNNSWVYDISSFMLSIYVGCFCND